MSGTLTCVGFAIDENAATATKPNNFFKTPLRAAISACGINGERE